MVDVLKNLKDCIFTYLIPLGQSKNDSELNAIKFQKENDIFNWDSMIYEAKIHALHKTMWYNLCSSLDLTKSHSVQIKQIIDSEFLLSNPTNELLVESFKKCENYSAILLEKVPSRKLLKVYFLWFKTIGKLQ